MIVPFTVDPAIFASFSDSRDDRKRHESLIQLWAQVGQLVLLADAEKNSRIAQALLKAPPSIQAPWKNALKHYLKTVGAKEFDETLKSDELSSVQGFAGELQLVSLEETRASCWGLDEDAYSKVQSGMPEMCRFGDEDRSAAFSNALAICQKPIDESYSTGQVWHERIKDLARVSRVIVVSDRYAIKNFLAARNQDSIGLGHLLHKLSALASPPIRNVEILATIDPGEQYRGIERTNRLMSLAQDAYNGLSSFCCQLRGKAIREINLRLADDKEFGRVEHYRYLRFGDRHLLQLDKGVSVLDGIQVTQTCTIHLYQWALPTSRAFREDEKKVRELCLYEYRINCLSDSTV